MNPFELHGPAYLSFYTGVLTFGAVSALVIRHMCLANDTNPWIPAESAARELDPYEAAYISDGADRVTVTACAALARHGIVEIDRTAGTVFLKENTVTERLHPLEQELVDDLKRGSLTLEKAKTSLNYQVNRIRTRLVEKGLAADDATKTQARLIPWLWFIGLTLSFSIPKIQMAIHEGRPHNFLVLMCVVAGMLSFCFLKGIDLTNKGRMARIFLRESNSALQLTAQSNPTGLSLRDTAMAYGVFGALTLAGDPFSDALFALKPRHTGGSCSSGSGCGSSCGSSCGGGGCGGGCGG